MRILCACCSIHRAVANRAPISMRQPSTRPRFRAAARRWFAWQRIVGAFGEEPRPLGLFQLAIATVRESKDILPTTPRTLLSAALTGTPLPSSLLYQAVRRNRAGQKVTLQRAALIKLVFASRQSVQQEDVMAQLDPTNAT